MSTTPGKAKLGPLGDGVRVKSLLVVVACCAAMLWSWRSMTDSGPAVETLKQLRAPDTEERLFAAERLGSSEPDEAGTVVPALLDAMGDDDDRVRAAAARSIGALQMRAAGLGVADEAAARGVVRALLDALRGPGPRGRAAAADALALVVGTPASGRPAPLSPDDLRSVERGLIERLGDVAAEPRAAAAGALGALAARDPALAAAAPPDALFAAFERDADPDVRARAATALAAYAAAYDRVAEALARGVASDHAAVSLASGNALTMLASKRKTDPVPPRAVAALVEALQSPAVNARQAALQVLGGLGPRAVGAVDPLLALLRDRHAPSVLSGLAAEALGRIAPETPRRAKVLAALRDAALSDATPVGSTRRSAVEALGKFGTAAVPALVAVLNDDTAYVGFAPYQAGRLLATFAPGTPQAPEAVDALAATLASRLPLVRAEAAAALGQFGSEAAGAVERLRRLAEEDPSNQVRLAAGDAVRRIEAAGGK